MTTDRPTKREKKKMPPSQPAPDRPTDRPTDLLTDRQIEGPGVARAGERSLRIQVVGGDGVFYSAPLPPPLPTRQAELLLSLSRVSDILQALRSIGPVTYGRATGTITWDERHTSKLPVR